VSDLPDDRDGVARPTPSAVSAVAVATGAAAATGANSAAVDAASLRELLLWDRRALERQRARIEERRARRQPIGRELAQFESEFVAAHQRAAARRASLPPLRYPEDLPVVGRRMEIAEAIRAHQVVVVAGETGSGKTTQLPKILLECGIGLRGQIAHTQPRRIAARTVAARVAEELGVPLGGAVGFKVRFTDKSARETLLKVMTDGILLAELREDPDLLRYEAVIVDEAHERSLNIDFLLGYLQRLLPRRPELKLVITSATIDPQRFAQYYGRGTPVIEVSGRTYPVETRYRQLGEDEDDAFDPGLTSGILKALDEIEAERGEIGAGDVLVFLPGEREIREAADAIEQARGARVDVLPLYSRLSWADQQRVFQRGGRRRVVLATNVAETSITVPGIRSVIDSGLARLSHYSPRVKIQRLPIEPISKASADQRRGRCGRVGAGLCIRLYGEDDYDQREAFTPPEVLRTNLASVILQMESLGLGSPADFPFVDPPETRLVNDGYRLLQELEAVDEERHVTAIGRQMARLPVDPRIARMLVEAHRHGALAEMLVLAAALSIQDPRERPSDKQQAADEKHAAFADPKSDLVALLNLWTEYQKQRAALTRNALRRWCAAQFLSAARMREWEDLLAQLGEGVADLDWRPNDKPADYERLHRASLAGLLGSIGEKQEAERGARGGEFLGPRGLRFSIAPGTPLKGRPPRWLMAASLVETQRVYARLVAAVEPAWIEAAARHLVKREYGEPEWDAERGIVTARETVTLYGLTLAAGRRVNYGTVAPREAREMFVREALVHGRSRVNGHFLDRNRALKVALAREEATLRRHVVLVDEPDEAAFYLARLPDTVHSTAALERWRKETPSSDSQLTMTEADLRRPGAPSVDRALYPERLALGGNRLPVEYRFEPHEPDDGATVTVPEPLLPKLTAGEVDWGVPGWLDEKITALIRGLPKVVRRHLVPAPDVATRCVRELAESRTQPFLPALAACLGRIAGQPIAADALAAVELSPHLRLNLRVLDATGRVVAEGRELRELQRGARQAPAVRSAPGEQWDRPEVRAWDFGLLPDAVRVNRQGVDLELHPALVDRGTHAQLTLYADGARAEAETRRGVLRLLALSLEPQLRTAQKVLASDRESMLLHQLVGASKDFARDVAERALERACLPAGTPVPRSPDAFEATRERGRPELVGIAERLGAKLRETLGEHHRVAAEIRALPDGLDAELVDDVRAQLARLVHAGFVRATPDPWLDSLTRFVKAVGRRAGKLRGMRGAVADAQWDLHVAWRRLAALAARATAADRGRVAELEQLRWLLDEYCVQLFAQDLKTSVPVSAKRIAQAFEAVEAALRA
jgi:ATP-dependent helicase HrpA